MLLIYGATGFTGRLVAAEARAQGLPITIGGRGSSAGALADELGVRARQFAVDDPSAAAAGLEGIAAVLNCAGPFSLTSEPLARACMERGAHYLDLAGEVPEHARIEQLDGALRAAGVAAVPGVGFGIVPTECAAALAARALPGADALTIAYETRGGASKGTLETVLPSLHEPGHIRRRGALEPRSPGASKRRFGDGDRSVLAVGNPWRADLVGAARSTGIPDIETMSTFPWVGRLLMRIGGSAPGRGLVRLALATASAGPDEKARARGSTAVWAEARRGDERREVLVRGPDAYTLTARAAALSARRALGGLEPGYHTPSTAFGADYLAAIDGVEVSP